MKIKRKPDGFWGVEQEAQIPILHLPFSYSSVFLLEPGTEEIKKLLLLLLGCAVQVSLMMFMSVWNSFKCCGSLFLLFWCFDLPFCIGTITFLENTDILTVKMATASHVLLYKYSKLCIYHF